MTALALLLAVGAFVALGLATDEHHLRRRGRLPDRRLRRDLRRGAWASLTAAFVLAVAAAGWVFGPILWTGLVMLGAGAAFLALNFWPTRRSRES